MKTEITKIDPKEFGLDENQAVLIEKDFAPIISEREALINVYEGILTKEISGETIKEARDIDGTHALHTTLF